ncbi:MAG: hypothetical protein AAB675_00600 [Patescibacteria group bacterium]
MAEISAGKEFKNKTSTWGKLRNVISGVLLTGTGVVAVEAVTPIDPVSNTGQRIENVVSDIKHNIETKGQSANGQYLRLAEDGTYVSTDIPEVVKVVIEPNADPTTRFHNGNDIIVQRKPKIDSGDILVDPKEITAQYAVRVPGGAYGSPREIGRFMLNGKPTGLWFQPWDPMTQQPVNLKNEPLTEGKDKEYISGNQVSVKETLISEPTPIHTPTNQ